MSELTSLTIAEASELIRAKKLSPLELVSAYLARIASFDSQVNAFITVTAEKAMEQARSAERAIVAGRHRGPLHGIPFALKDIYETSGIRTTAHSRVCAEYVPTRDAAAVQKLYRAGAILVGKLATHEFARGGPCYDLPWPPARNPWSLDRFTGGSSTGSGAAVAAGFVPLALGTDTGGSVRTPASLCGVVGLKPTYGRVSRRGIIPNSFTFDHCGPLTWTVEDCAIALQALAGYDPGHPSSSSRPVPDYRGTLTQGIRGLRIGAVRHFWESDLPASGVVRTEMDNALDVLRDLGATVEDVRLRPMQAYSDVKVAIAEAEVFSVHQQNLMHRLNEYGFDFRVRVVSGCLFTPADYVQAQRERRKLLAEASTLFENYDVLVASGAYGPAPRLTRESPLGFWSKPQIGAPFSVIAGPVLVVCIGFAEGLPLGMQIAGRPFEEEAVFRVGYAFEKATPWRKRRPILTTGKAPPPIEITARPGPRPSDAATRQSVSTMLTRSGIELPEDVFDYVCEAAPHVWNMSRRIPRDHDYGSEPAAFFSFPPAPRRRPRI